MELSKESSDEQEGACALLRDALRLSRGDLVLLLCQDDYSSVAERIEAAASGLGIKSRTLKFPREDFVDGYKASFGEDFVQQQNPRGIAVLMEWSAETTRGRLSLLEHLSQSGQKWRIASMPGVDKSSLCLCRGNIEELDYQCRLAFAGLARTRRAMLQTPNPEGSIDELIMPINRMPIISSGAIEDGQWGNVPSGETFVVPVPYRAAGWITICGSIPKRPLKGNEWIRFCLANGRITRPSIIASSPSLQVATAELFFGAKAVRGRNANALAELGIGVNPNISRLTGNPIFDEKKSGTVHIAFGRNSQFGGPLKSAVHHDLVATDSTLVLSNRNSNLVAVEKGVFSLTKTTAVPVLGSDVRGVSLPRKVKRQNGMCAHKLVRTKSQTSLVLEYLDFRNQVHEFEVATGALARLADNVIQATPTSKYVGLERLRAQIRCVENSQFDAIISGLIFYQIITGSI